MREAEQEASNLLLLKDNDIGHSVHLCELFAVEGRHQLPGSGLRGDKVLRQRHRGVTTNITEREKQEWDVSVDVEEEMKGVQWEEDVLGSYPTTTSWPFCRPRPSTLKITPFSTRGRGLVKVILAAISLPTTASPKGCRRVIQKKSEGLNQTFLEINLKLLIPKKEKKI